jgi:aryl-alcohol dehydrogenase-like predicted oxidoreductase
LATIEVATSGARKRKKPSPSFDASYKAGINFFDTANGYSNGVSEEILGKAIKLFHWPHENIVIATKLFSCRAHQG